MMFLRFAMAWLRVQWARYMGYRVLATPDEARLRYKYCRRCSRFNGAECELCGCLVQAKTMLAVESCPRGLWGPIWVKIQRPAGLSR